MTRKLPELHILWMLPVVPVIAFVMAVIFFAYAPFLLDCEPQEYSNALPSNFSGPLEVNSDLNMAQLLYEGQLVGPESLAVHKGYIYTGTIGGQIVRLKGNTVTTVAKIGKDCKGPWEERVCGRPLGMRFDSSGTLYVVDAYYGLYKVNVETGTVTPLVTSETKIDGKKICFLNDLELDKDGTIYFVESSNKWPLSNVIFIALEHENTGRVLKYDPKTKQTSVILDKLYFPNGVQLTHDGDALLVAENSNFRVLKLYIKGPKKGKTEVFADRLPGEPDNIRPSARGGYWITVVSGRHEGSPLPNDRLGPYPLFRKAMMRGLNVVGNAMDAVVSLYPIPTIQHIAYELRTGRILYGFMRSYGMVLELDKDGNIIRSLHSPDYKVGFLSEVLEHEGELYIGSFRNPFLVKAASNREKLA